MRRPLAILAALTVALAACTPADTTGGTAAPQKTGDSRQSRLDIAYSFLSDASVHSPTSKQLLNGALAAMKKEATTSGGSADVATPDFTADTETNLADFKKFAAAAGALAAKNSQLSAQRLAEGGIVGNEQADPDRPTHYPHRQGGAKPAPAAP